MLAIGRPAEEFDDRMRQYATIIRMWRECGLRPIDVVTGSPYSYSEYRLWYMEQEQSNEAE